MNLYDGLLFFIVLAAVLVGAVILGLCEVRLKWYGLVATVAILLCVFDSWQSKACLAGFYILELLCVQIYLQVHEKCGKRPILWLFLLISLAPLTMVKLQPFVGTLGFFRLVGVSYMTFRSVQVLIEIYDGLIKEVKIADFSYFLLFFPSVSSGPIDRYRRFVTDLERKPSRDEYAEMARKGIWKLMFGALMNFGIGNFIYANWLAVLPESGLAATISYMYGYTFFLFFNFAGYSLMAVGTAYILGIKMPDNFNLPFLSVDMKDFWSRWHISLSTWLRDYVYTRFCAAALKGEWFRDRRTCSYIGYVITMMTMGVWHGLTPAYLIYGAYHGALMCVNDLLDTRWKRFKKIKKSTVGQIVLVLITFHLFSFGLLIFSGRII